MTSWEAEKKQFLSEPVFVANPAGSSEDDGVLLVSMLDYATGKDRLIVLDATSMSVLAQVYFPEDCSICIPEADHGLFLSGSA
ncbi:hypothetical protein EB796_007126 [Bugula neritina]|uniref:BCO2 n=1 Tax=Bugula neritina TaxID=10212 RepID=A0A7J7KAD1_BUGNE|nr:hypothetical protein EB796_007126 [Bugula neritina]